MTNAEYRCEWVPRVLINHNYFLHKEAAKKVTKEAVSLLIREKHNMPDKGASQQEIEKWISDTLW